MLELIVVHEYARRIAGKQVLTKATAGVMSYGAKKFVSDVLGNPELANAVVNGSAAKQDQQKKDDQKKDD